eukprot:3936192-Rhodomonas_salina.2
MNPKRKAIHPHVSVTGMTTLLSRSPMTSVKVPCCLQRLGVSAAMLTAWARSFRRHTNSFRPS